MTFIFRGPCASWRAFFADYPQIQWIMGVRCELRDGAVQGISSVIPFPRDVIRSGSVLSAGPRLHHAGGLLLAAESLREESEAFR